MKSSLLRVFGRSGFRNDGKDRIKWLKDYFHLFGRSEKRDNWGVFFFFFLFFSFPNSLMLRLEVDLKPSNHLILTRSMI